MREILFRGKCKGNGVWVEGFYACFNKKESRIYTGYAETDDGYYYPEWFTVVPETVGQYTGLTDKNGNKIFEGDIVKCISKFDAKDMVVIFEAAEFHLVDCQRYKNYTECCGYRYFGTLETEVIGNIHDNPELMEGLL